MEEKMLNEQNGCLFPKALTESLRSQIAFPENQEKEQIYFENAGGSLTLKSCCDMTARISKIPDFAGRPTPEGMALLEEQNAGLNDAMLLFGARSGTLLAELTVSKALFTITETVFANAKGTNVVCTELDHPATYDACRYYCQEHGKEFRTVPIDSETGSLRTEDILSKIDKNTFLLSIIHASNITGALVDIKTIVREARVINPDIYVIADSTQHVPHAPIDVEDLDVDAAGFAPYKMLGKRGLGLVWISDRLAAIKHPRFLDCAKNDWDLGGYEPAGLIGVSLVNDYICEIGRSYCSACDRRRLLIEGMKAIHLHERALIHRLVYGSSNQAGIIDIPNVHVHFVDDLTKRDAIIPLTFDRIDHDDVLKKYIENGIYVFNREAKSVFSRRVMNGIGLQSVVRISPMHYNTFAEIDKFLAITELISNNQL